MLTYTEENYLKALLKNQLTTGEGLVGTSALAGTLSVKPATANDMLKKLKEKGLVAYEKYGKIGLTTEGSACAMQIIRRHRLWETFLCEKLGFSWDEVHEVAEQLEHVQSEKLIAELDRFLNYPKFDPHGDPIPNRVGEMHAHHKLLLSAAAVGATCVVVAVKDNSSDFLTYVAELGLAINDQLAVQRRSAFDGQMVIAANGQLLSISSKFSDNIFVTVL
jgi:DtxR family transcriptional regulator, Mn-dependent transcriptional regulator